MITAGIRKLLPCCGLGMVRGNRMKGDPSTVGTYYGLMGLNIG